MTKCSSIFLSAICILSVCGSVTSSAQESGFPDRPIRLVVGYTPGGPTDSMARFFAERLAAKIGQAVIVDNRAGAGGNTAATLVARAAPDGYTLLMTTVATHGIVPALSDKLPFDPIKDFAPVREVSETPTVLVVTNSLPVSSVAELIAYVKAHPNKVNFASGGVGTSMHFSGELFRSLAHLDIVHVPYQGSSAAYTDLIAGNVQMMFDPLTAMAPLIKSGKVRALAVTSEERSPLFPNVPTMVSSGFPDMIVSSWAGIVAPARTPPAIVNKLASALDAVSSEDSMRVQMAPLGAVPVKSSPSAFAAFIAQEMTRWKKVAEAANIHVD